MKSIQSYFDFAIEKGASDIHLVGGEKPAVRIDGKLKAFQKKEILPKEFEEAVFELLNEEQKEKFVKTLELDFGHQVGDTRFRINLHWQEGKIGLAARLIPKDIPTLDDIDLTDIAKRFIGIREGLVMVVGSTGQGKSTSIASMIEEINKTRKEHVVTIEDPIEFIFEDKLSLIEQREIGVDTHSFADALKHVLRQDPNVIFVGEMRDPETIATVLTAAETGHLVFSTMHTASVVDAIERIVDVFEGSKQRQVLIQLSSVLRGVIAQQLLIGKDGKRVAAREILINTPAVANLIRENNIAQMRSVVQTSKKDGMVTMKSAIDKLLNDGIIGGDNVHEE